MIIVPEQTGEGTFQEVSLTPEKIGASPSDHNHDASALTTGTLDVERIPVLPSQKQIMSSGELNFLTAEQEAEIGQGTIVTTVSGLRYVYKGTGDKKSVDSYIVLADVTPHWNSIFAKPTTFSPSAHTHPISEVTDLQSGLDAKLDKSGGTVTGKLVLSGGVNVAPAIPSNIQNGDLWVANAALNFRDNTGADKVLAAANAINLFTRAQVVDVSANNTAFRITQRGTGEALRVEDSTNLDTTAFVIDANGRVGVGVAPDATAAIAVDAGGVKFGDGTVQTSAVAFDGSGKIASALLPSFVDDVLDFENLAAFPATGETGKMYVALDTSKVYRWSGSAYIEISPSPGSTDSVPEGSVNLYHTAARAAAAAPVQSVNGQTGIVSISAASLGAVTGSELPSVYVERSADAASQQAGQGNLVHQLVLANDTRLKRKFGPGQILQFSNTAFSNSGYTPGVQVSSVPADFGFYPVQNANFLVNPGDLFTGSQFRIRVIVRATGAFNDGLYVMLRRVVIGAAEESIPGLLDFGGGAVEIYHAVSSVLPVTSSWQYFRLYLAAYNGGNGATVQDATVYLEEI
jgi:hypothetical protein